MALLSRSKLRRASIDQHAPGPSAQRQRSLTDPLLGLQRSIGNSEVLRLYGVERPHTGPGDRGHGASAARNLAAPALTPGTQGAMGVVQRKGSGEGITLGKIGEMFMRSPRALSDEARRYTVEAGQLLTEMDPSDSLYDRVHKVYWGFGRLISELKGISQGQQTTPAQRQQATNLALKWQGIRNDIVARDKRKGQAALKRARASAQAVRKQVLYAYRDIFMGGKEPEDVKAGAGNVQSLAEKATDLLKTINEAEAGFSGRSVTPLIPVFDNARSLVNLIAGWNVTSGLAAQSQADFAALQNVWKATETTLGIAGLGKFLPLFGHIGPMLDHIAKGLDRLVRKRQEKNREWWEAREVMGDKLPHRGAMPIQGAAHEYMKRVYSASEPLPGRPPPVVVKFFNDNREMFSRSAKEVMGESLGKIPTKRSWVFWRKADPDKLNEWVFYHRDMVWRLIHGRGWDPPK